MLFGRQLIWLRGGGGHFAKQETYRPNLVFLTAKCEIKVNSLKKAGKASERMNEPGLVGLGGLGREERG